MLRKEMMKPYEEKLEKVETFKELEEREEFAEDEYEGTIVEGEEDILLVDNKAATLILVQESGSWRTRHLRAKNQSSKTESDSCTRKVNACRFEHEEYPRSRISSLRRMWSIERVEESKPEEIEIEDPKSEETETDSEQKVKVKMIRIKPTQAPMEVEDPKEDKTEEETIKDKGYQLGSSANQCEFELNEVLTRIGELEVQLEIEYEAVIKDDKRPEWKLEEILWKQIYLEREKVKAYEKGYIREKLLRMRAVTELMKHEQRLYGQLNPIARRYDVTYVSSSNHTRQRFRNRRNTIILDS